ncbi:MAG: helix-turn-helix domain-containing protein [Candidatus Methylomirabilales bacterium]
MGTHEEIEMMLTVKDLVADSKISRQTWWAWIRQGLLPVSRLGRQIRVAEEDYRKFLADRRSGRGTGTPRRE